MVVQKVFEESLELYVCPISYFDWVDDRRRSIDVYFQKVWHEEYPHFNWGNLHFFIKAENYHILTVEEIPYYEARILMYNQIKYKCKGEKCGISNRTILAERIYITHSSGGGIIYHYFFLEVKRCFLLEEDFFSV